MKKDKQILVVFQFVLFIFVVRAQRSTVSLFVTKLGFDSDNPLSQDALEHNATLEYPLSWIV